MVLPAGKGTSVCAVRDSSVGCSSENTSIEVSVVCAFIAGGADLGHEGFLSHLRSVRMTDGHRSFAGPVLYLLAHNGYLGCSGVSGMTPHALVQADEPSSLGTLHPC